MLCTPLPVTFLEFVCRRGRRYQRRDFSFTEHASAALGVDVGENLTSTGDPHPTPRVTPLAYLGPGLRPDIVQSMVMLRSLAVEDGG